MRARMGSGSMDNPPAGLITMRSSKSYTRHQFQALSGYILPPGDRSHHGLVAVGHTALVPPWTDPAVHSHSDSEECYVLLRGELRFRVAGATADLRPREMLVVHPHVPHAIIGGTGPIEHIGIRAPAMDDKVDEGATDSLVANKSYDAKRELRARWGYRIPLGSDDNQNCWLLGADRARFPSSHLIFAYLNFRTHEKAKAGAGLLHRLHYHQDSWEYYLVLQGSKTIRIENEMVTLRPGDLLETPPGVRHTVVERQAPYEGITFRVPIRLDDKVVSPCVV